MLFVLWEVPGDVDIGHAWLREEVGEHGVEADHVEQVDSVVSLHLIHVRHVLPEKKVKSNDIST